MGKTLLMGLLATQGCVMSDEVVLPPAPHVEHAAPAPGLTDGCEDTRTPGRFLGHVYVLPVETRWLPDYARLPVAGTLCLDRLDVSERRGYPSFPGIANRAEWFGVDSAGAFTVVDAGTYGFRLTSDDGSRLLIDGVTVLDNDGFHQTRTVATAVQLNAGVHVIEVPYWQGPGPLSLVLEVARPDAGGRGPYEVFRIDQPLRVGA